MSRTRATQIRLVVGRRDQPVDGVWDYAFRVAESLRTHGVSAGVMAVPWNETGWLRALLAFFRDLERSGRTRVVLQVTHLAWSRRGFSLPMLLPLLAAKLARLRVAAVLHDPFAFEGRRLRDRVRRSVQHLGMRSVIQLADMVFVTVEPVRLPWAKRSQRKLRLLVVGSNVGKALGLAAEQGQRNSPFTVAVFGCTEGLRGREERQTIVQVAERVAEKVGHVRVVAFGRGTAPKGARWPEALGVAIESYGLVPSEQASVLLRNSDALLFVRGAVSSRRGSAVAAIAHGLPVVGFASSETGWPITEGGVMSCRLGDVEGLANALVRVATDTEFAASLRRRSAEAYDKYFSWDAIVSRLLAALEEERYA
jgi:hypothetical protein